MARRLFGLDVGTSAVTIAGVVPGDPPTLETFGQVALPTGALREGEVEDPAALTEAVQRLRAEVGIKKASVRLGVSSPRVVVRRIEMPEMTRQEVAGALDFQAADFIPFSLDEA
ncbi:MAG: type IV pilus biogenesis protein PilM, partial [Actinomycetota bacterium]